MSLPPTEKIELLSKAQYEYLTNQSKAEPEFPQRPAGIKDITEFVLNSEKLELETSQDTPLPILHSFNSERIRENIYDYLVIEKFDIFSNLFPEQAIVHDSMIFRECTFSAPIHFQYIGSDVHFDNCVFRNCNISASAKNHFKFNNCTFSDTKFTSPNGSIHIIDSTFESIIQLIGRFTGIFEVRKSIFNTYPVVNTKGFSQDVYLYDNTYNVHTKRSEAMYRAIKKEFNENHDSLQESFFASHELQSKYLPTSKTKVDIGKQIVAWFHYGINRMGRSIWWPLIWTFFLSLIFALIVAGLCDKEIIQFEAIDEFNPVFKRSLMKYLMGPFALIKPELILKIKDSWFILIDFIFSAVISVLYYFFIAGIRKNFKLN